MSLDVEAAGALLARLRNEVRAVDDLPDGLCPHTIEEGYAIQDALIDALGSPIAGRKVGATAAAAQKILGVDGPFVGTVLRPTIIDSPAELKAKDYPMLPAVECEFAFRVGDAGEAIDLIPAIEVVATRYGRITGIPGPSLIADNGAATALVLGSARPAAGVDTVSAGVRLVIDGVEIASGTGAAVLGDPRISLQFALNNEAERGRPITAGEVVTTGSCTSITPIDVGQHVVADFGDLGTVELYLH